MKINTVSILAIKQDVYIQDEIGFMNMQVFENVLQEFSYNCFHKVTCKKLESYQRNLYLSLTKNSVITSAAATANLTAPYISGIRKS